MGVPVDPGPIPGKFIGGGTPVHTPTPRPDPRQIMIGDSDGDGDRDRGIRALPASLGSLPALSPAVTVT